MDIAPGVPMHDGHRFSVWFMRLEVPRSTGRGGGGLLTLLTALAAAGCAGVLGAVPAPMAVVSATASADDGNVASNAVDGNWGTRWSAHGDGQWICLDLGGAADLGSVQVAWHKGDQRAARFEVQTSERGTNWATVFTGESSGATTNLEAYELSRCTGRYVRILGHGNSQDLWNSILEAVVRGPDAGANPGAIRLSISLAGPGQGPPGGVPSGETVSLQWYGVPGEWYQMQASPNLVVWEDTGGVITNAAATQTWHESDRAGSAASWGARSYRLKKVPHPPPPTNAVALPSSVLNLGNWKLTVPVDTAHAGNPDEYLQPELAGFRDTNYFHVNAGGDGVVFTAPCGGATTSGSGYPRSELREMVNAGAGLAGWSTTSGTHTMEITQAITHLPDVKPHVVAGQIHGPSDDVIVFRLEGAKLFVDENGTAGPVLTASYQLGDVFTVKFSAHDGGVDCYYNARYIYTYPVSASGCYFKAGCYTQSNPSKGDAPTAYGEVVIHGLSVTSQ
jgi:hypothetical protein